ncbi:MAG: hypothetical protein R3E44_12295 [Paracoccaceae bacterium]
MHGAEVQEMAASVAALLETRLKLRGRDLPEKLRRGRRRLPRKIRREAEYLAAAAEQARHPKLSVQLDRDRIVAAHEACLGYLRPIGAAARRRAVLLDMLTGVGSAVFVGLVLLVGLMIWRTSN